MANRTKMCTRCGETKPIEDFLPRKNRGPDSRHSQCHPCRRERGRRYYQANRDKVIARTSAYQRENREQSLGYWRKYNEANRERLREDAARYRAENPDRIRQQRRAFNERNPDKHRKDAHARRAMLAKVEHDPAVTLESLRVIHGDTCCYCPTLMDFHADQYASSRATVEHIVPISRGGSHTFDNTTLACRSCNVSKRNSPLIWGWVARRASI